VPARGFVIVDISRFIKWLTLLLAALGAMLAGGAVALAADAVTLTLKDHHFAPSELSVPAGVRFRIEVENQDATPAEFESSDLRVEKIVVPGGKIVVMVGPLKPGTYKFFDDYHPDTATGTMTAVAGKAQD
jgi:heme/copper-type cytochrome/quinol oxidase subunit 2